MVGRFLNSKSQVGSSEKRGCVGALVNHDGFSLARLQGLLRSSFSVFLHALCFRNILLTLYNYHVKAYVPLLERYANSKDKGREGKGTMGSYGE